MQYLTELHCHSRDGSGCSSESAEGIVAKYTAAGYTTVVLTNHFIVGGARDNREAWLALIDEKFKALEILQKAAEGSGLNILMGFEYRFWPNVNDYLVYGCTREWLEDQGDVIPPMTIRDFSKLARENGFFLLQAHPFRHSMTTVDPMLLDGIEVYNGHPEHNSNNDVALHMALKYDRCQTSGTDHHHPHHKPTGGIVTDRPITTEQQLIDVLKSGVYLPLHAGEDAIR